MFRSVVAFTVCKLARTQLNVNKHNKKLINVRNQLSNFHADV